MARESTFIPGDVIVEGSVSIGSPDNRDLRVRFFGGAGTPEGSVSAPVGSQYNRTDGPPWVYIKESGGKGNTGWVAEIS